MNSPKVKKGDNNLVSCYQFKIIVDNERKVLNVKIYDKIMDCAGKEGIKLVGSKIKEVIGSKREINSF